MALKRWLLGLIVVLTLAGCGQKGPLYFPEEDDEQEEDEQQTLVEPTVYIA